MYLTIRLVKIVNLKLFKIIFEKFTRMREIDKIYAGLFNNIICFISIKEYIIKLFFRYGNSWTVCCFGSNTLKVRSDLSDHPVHKFASREDDWTQ